MCRELDRLTAAQSWLSSTTSAHRRRHRDGTSREALKIARRTRQTEESRLTGNTT
jgi:hypothetical protein